MVLKKTGTGKQLPVGVFAVIMLLIAVSGLVVFKTQVFTGGAAKQGLSGRVSVRGTVSLEQLEFTDKEIAVINRAVNEHSQTFTRVDLIVDSDGPLEEMNGATVLVMAMELRTADAMVVKSWSRKIQRGKMVAQVSAYIGKAAVEYQEFKRFPDVQKNFKTLYI